MARGCRDRRAGRGALVCRTRRGDRPCPRSRAGEPLPDHHHQCPRAADDLLADRAYGQTDPSCGDRSWCRASGVADLVIAVDIRERYPFTFADRQATTRREPLQAGDYGLLVEERYSQVSLPRGRPGRAGGGGGRRPRPARSGSGTAARACATDAGRRASLGQASRRRRLRPRSDPGSRDGAVPRGPRSRRGLTLLSSAPPCSPARPAGGGRHRHRDVHDLRVRRGDGDLDGDFQDSSATGPGVRILVHHGVVEGCCGVSPARARWEQTGSRAPESGGCCRPCWLAGSALRRSGAPRGGSR